MKANPVPPLERLRSLFAYNPDTGELTWLPRAREEFPNDGLWRWWNATFSGKPAGHAKRHSRNPNKFQGILISLNGRYWWAHRIAWAMHHGSLDEQSEIDHRNLNPLDNRLINLRLATRGQNARNMRKDIPQRKLPRGVYETKHGLFFTSICVNGVKRHLGTFSTAGQAQEAYRKASAKYHGEFGRTD
jgi:hypothetical protein